MANFDSDSAAIEFSRIPGRQQNAGAQQSCPIVYNRALWGGTWVKRFRFLVSLMLALCTADAGFAQNSGGQPALNDAQAQVEAARFLADLIRIDSQDPPGNESKVASYLQGVLKDAGIDSELLQTVPGRDSIVARLKGDGS